jgi:class 3 adenylate cyclase
MEVFHLSTVGDCYIATTGVPYPREDHAILLAQFSRRCRRKANKVLQRLLEQGEMTGISQLKIRIGIHSGPVLAGVFRGNNNRFDMFGDTINTASRIESTGELDRIHLSKDTAKLLQEAGKCGC